MLKDFYGKLLYKAGGFICKSRYNISYVILLIILRKRAKEGFTYAK